MTYMPKFLPTDSACSTEADLLNKRSHEGLSRILARHNTSTTEARYTDRLEAELKVINDKTFSSYFLIVADYVNRNNDDPHRV